MGACVSSNAEETEQKKRSQMIDRALEEDSKKLRRECKILLLGRYVYSGLEWRLTYQRVRREWEVNDCQADEDYTSERLHGGGTIHVSNDHL